MDRVRRVKMVLWLIAGLAFSVSAFRFLFGLGVSTNLTDATPWGIWIGLDLLSGVALAAGGFVICAVVYVMKREEFHSIVRPAVLTAFLGYLAFVAGLVFDVGLPWTIWHVMINWNIHSALFEVAWCVMLYTSVLALEFLPVPLESTSRFAKVRALLIKIRLPLVILGIMLSTLHQSSLGSLFLIMPHRVHPLWYSPIVPILFFISAISLGLMMVVFEGLVSSSLYRKGPEINLFEKLGSAARWVLIIFVGTRIMDLLVRGKLGYAFEWDWRVPVFWFEVLAGGIVPIIILSIQPLRRSLRWLWVASTLVVVGIMTHRLSIGGFTHLDRGTPFYFPSWSEVTISLGIFSAAALTFLFAIEHFNIWDEKPADPESAPEAVPEFDPVSRVWLGTPAVAARTKYSLAFILAAALGFALLSTDAESSKRGIDDTQAVAARGEMTTALFIDGNIDGFGTTFKHAFHEEKNGGKDSCVLCHHMNLPRDKNSGCADCHSSMYEPTDAFGHDWHASPDGGKLGCLDCHRRGEPRSKETAKSCDKCHKDLIPEGTAIKVEKYDAGGYVDAMHDLCIECHRKKSVELDKPDLPRCGTCHKAPRSYVDDPKLAERYQELMGKGVVIPVPKENQK
jgi:Ni/Fe-hydrogenase subunit HybB-like protein